MSKQIVFMFSGQGSQFFQMGRELYEEHPVFRRLMDQLNELIRRSGGEDIVRELYGPSSKAVPFTDIRFTTPAIFMIELALAQVLIESGLKPSLTLGASLGTFAAACISGCISIPQAVNILLAQVEALNSRCEPGGMCAVLAPVSIVHSGPCNSKATVAAVNFSNHFVLSAHARDLPEIEDSLRNQSVTFQRLPVSHAYHSHWMDPAKDALVRAGEAAGLQVATVPLACCATAAATRHLPGDYFWRVVRDPILFQQTIENLEKEGGYHYLDVGPSGSLATLTKYLLPSNSRSTVGTVMSPYGREMQRLNDAIQ